MELTVSTFSIVSFILAIVSATLAIAAFIFSWVSFNNTSKLQIKAQEILSKVSEKVEVVVERTSHQMDKAWDYLTSSQSLTTDQIPKVKDEKEEKLKEKLIKEARQEATEVLKESGVDQDKIEELRSKVEALIEKTTERTETMVEQHKLLRSISTIESTAKTLAKLSGMEIDSKTSLNKIIEFLKGKIIPPAHRDLTEIIHFGKRLLNKDINIGMLPDSKIDSIAGRSKRILTFLQRQIDGLM